jgi:hypothetical protein
MFEASEKKEQSKIPSIQVLSLIEKASEFQWMLQMISFALFVDSVMVLAGKSNFLNWPWRDFNWTSQISAVVIACIVFIASMACLIPILEGIFSWVIRLAYIYSPFFTIKADDYRRSDGMVRAYELQDQADEEQSDYLLAKVKEVEEKRKNANEEARKLGSIAFKTATLLFVNLFLIGSESLQTTPQYFLTFIQPDKSFTIIIANFIGLGALCVTSWCRDYYPSTWIRYVPLYQKIVQEKERKKQYET